MDVLAIFKIEIVFSQKYSLHFDLGKYKLHLFTGEQFRGGVSEFQTLGGGQIIIGSDLIILKTPVVGREAFAATYLQGKIQELQELSDAIITLPQKYVGFHLLHYFLSYGRV